MADGKEIKFSADARTRLLNGVKLPLAQKGEMLF